tara:strand:+ start:62 stop:301 length:240 start_codon:yes stop_codon:yes gene_type:complete
MSEVEEKTVNPDSEDILASEEESIVQATPEEEVHVVPPYPERVPNAEKGADHAHAYVMLKVLFLLVVFSLVIAKFTSPF